jgi:hypothetical protein
MSREAKLTQHVSHKERVAATDNKSRLRNFYSQSYADDGRAAPSSVPETSSYSFDKGESYRATNQFEAACNSFKSLDARRTQISTPVSKRAFKSER